MPCELRLQEDDRDLVPILRASTDGELDPPVSLILEKGWVSKELHKTDVFRKWNGGKEHSRYADEISAEIQLFGGNSAANLLRKKGIPYAEIVSDVAKKTKTGVGDGAGTVAQEDAILEKLFESTWEQMDEAQKRAVMEQLGGDARANVSKAAFLATLQIAIRGGGFASCQLSVIAANAVARQILGRGLSFAATAGMNRAIGAFAGPIGWTLTTMWLANDLAGPAYRVTVPAVLWVAMLRKALKMEKPGVLFCGRSGHGKSSVINEIAGTELAEVGFERPTTPIAKVYRVPVGADRTLRLIDTRGIFESTAPSGAPSRSAVEELKTALMRNGSSLVAHTIAAPETRALERDFSVLADALDEVRHGLRVKPRLVALLSKCDTVGNPRKWPSNDNYRFIEKVSDYLVRDALHGTPRPLFPEEPWRGVSVTGARIPYISVVPVCALKDYAWNIETLLAVLDPSLGSGPVHLSDQDYRGASVRGSDPRRSAPGVQQVYGICKTGINQSTKRSWCPECKKSVQLIPRPADWRPR